MADMRKMGIQYFICFYNKFGDMNDLRCLGKIFNKDGKRWVMLTRDGKHLQAGYAIKLEYFISNDMDDNLYKILTEDEVMAWLI